jgi:hypothetical protein
VGTPSTKRAAPTFENTVQIDMREGREGAVARFLRCREIFSGWIDKLRGDPHHQEAIRITALLKEARLFMLPVNFVQEMWNDVMHRFEDDAANAIRVVTGDKVTEFNDQVYQRFILGEGLPKPVHMEILQCLSSPYPTRLPFPVTYLAFEAPIPPIRNQQRNKSVDAFQQHATVAYADVLSTANIRPPIEFLGIVLSLTACYSIINARHKENPTFGVPLPVIEYDETRWRSTKGLQRGYWYHGMFALMRAVPLIIDWIFDHKTIIESPYQFPQPKEKSVSISIPKKLPDPYYVVYMDDTVKVQSWLTERSKRPKTGTVHLSPQHRYDVREHDRVRVHRGPLPMDPKIRRRLEAVRPVSGRSYKIYTELQPDGEIAELLFKRGIKRKQPDEWMAVLVTPIHHHIKGPPEGPYIPSVRKAKQHTSPDDNNDDTPTSTN